ncbi:hypothetical protein [Vibrio furnissii]|nr:hypothetical protein [Vibrio furnissii]
MIIPILMDIHMSTRILMTMTMTMTMTMHMTTVSITLTPANSRW